MATTFTESITLAKIDCPSCGGTYAINERYRVQKREVGGGWICPYCKTDCGYWESENERLKKELDKKAVELRASLCDKLKEQSLREEAEGKLRRVHHGMCPCCKRSFSNLERHMKSKHPELRPTT